VVLGKTANDDKLIAALRKELVAATGGKAGVGRCVHYPVHPDAPLSQAVSQRRQPHSTPPAS
jgi:hypothetical protein